MPRTTLARWRAAQVQDKGSLDKERRPYLATECNDLPKAEKWRLQIIREIARKVSQIQNGNRLSFDFVVGVVTPTSPNSVAVCYFART